MGASSRVRTLHYFDSFASAGIRIDLSPFADDAILSRFYSKKERSVISYARAIFRRFRLLRSVHRFDLVWIEKELFPYLPATLERSFRRRGIPFVVDYDDAVFHNYDQHANPLIRTCLRRKIADVMRASTCVFAGNRYLAAYAREAGASRIEIIPTVVDIQRYVPREKPASREIRIGWIGSPATTHYLRILDEVLPRLGSEPAFRLVLVGAAQGRTQRSIPVEYVRWSETTEVEQIQNFDIGIMPLLDGLNERGKCGYKLIQYMACGLPVIASPVGVNSEIVQHGVNGFWASNPDEWVSALRQFAANKELRRSFGMNGRRRVEAEYSTQVMAPRLVKILHELSQSGAVVSQAEACAA